MKYIYISFILLIILCTDIQCNTTLRSSQYETDLYGYGSSGCGEIQTLIVFQDPYEITDISGNFPTSIVTTVRVDLPNQFLSLSTNYPYGNSTLVLEVTNSHNQTSEITLPTPFRCHYLPHPLPYKLKSSFLFDPGYGRFMANLDWDLPYRIPKLTCSSNIGVAVTNNCEIGYSLTLPQINIIPDMLKMVLPNIEVLVSDGLNNFTSLVFDNPLPTQLQETPLVSSLISFPANNSKLSNGDEDYLYVMALAQFSQINSSFVSFISNVVASPETAKVVLGEPEAPLYQAFLSPYYPRHMLYANNKEAISLGTLNYSSNSGYVNYPSIIGSKSSVFETDMSIIILESNNINDIKYPVVVSFKSFNPQVPFPFGYKTNTNTTWSYKYNWILPPYTFSGYAYIQQQLRNWYMSAYTITGNGITDSQPPQVHSIEYIKLDNNNFIARLAITDDISGLDNVGFFNPLTSNYKAIEVLVDGDLNNGTYEILISTGYMFMENVILMFTDIAGNSGFVNNPIDFDLTPLPSPLSSNTSSFTMDDILDFYFERNRVDTSFKGVTNTLYIKVRNPDPQVLPVLVFDKGLLFIQHVDNPDIYTATYNNATGYFEIVFTLHQRVYESVFKYVVVFPPLYLEFNPLRAKFGEKAVVRLYANNADAFPPQINNLTAIPSTVADYASMSDKVIGWEMEIWDLPATFSSGYIEIASNYDGLTMSRNFTVDDRVDGDAVKGIYRLTVSVENSQRSQTFYIKTMKLIDTLGNTCVFPIGQLIDDVNCFWNLGSNRTQRSIEFISANQQSDSGIPELVDFQVEPIVNSFSNERQFVVSFSTQDSNSTYISDISPLHNPVVILQGYSSFITMNTNFINSSNGVYHYNATVELPYGSAYNGLLISIHGITDNYLNINSYTSMDLKALGFTYVIKQQPNVTANPIIENWSDINEKGGELRLFGKKFGTQIEKFQIFIKYTENGPFASVQPVIYSSSALTMNVNPSKSPISIYLNYNGQESNTVIIQPKLIPPVMPDCQLLFNGCSGNGYCSLTGCVCSGTWFGPNCSSTIISNNNITNDPTNPSFNLISALISIQSIKELNFKGEIQNQHDIKQWLLIKDVQSDRTRYTYTTILSDNVLATQVKTQVDLFSKDVDISFADNTYLMKPGTLKYTISLGPYQFQSQLNSLQVVMSIQLNEPDQNSCTQTQNNYGLVDGNQIEWLQLRINDTSLYGKFIQNSVVDYRLGTVNNYLLSNSSTNVTIGMNLPFYHVMAMLDPDFSVLLDTEPIQNGTIIGNDCEENQSSKGLSRNKIIIISTICSVVGAAIIISVIIYVIKLKKEILFQKLLKASSNTK
ncbi:hypothetical protein DLAC_00621 [Tieghemostelium lacteum]|uniref:EGF-like domain-containing protein n=1 Tax=Tieghemostelium lacteum TaxID=361077 RepID=A0A152AAG4_TIELA|nr:hypothetical protein DLAC_00621 [Tieghemostelium lacteum]|eukprot:KYR03125.1 hypothetical protein DLAC_00621 [Tieghemostelium lacteum]